MEDEQQSSTVDTSEGPFSLDRINRLSLMNDDEQQSPNLTEAETSDEPQTSDDPQTSDEPQTADEPQSSEELQPSDEPQPSDSREIAPDWVYREGWVTVSFPFLCSLLEIHKHSMQKRQVKRWDYLIDAAWSYTKIWNRRALLWNERLDLKLYEKEMTAKKKDAMQNGKYSKEEMLERLRDAVKAIRRTEESLEKLAKRIEEADNEVQASAVTLSYMTKSFIERDLPVMDELTDELIKEQAKEGKRDQKVLMIKAELTVLMRRHKQHTEMTSVEFMDTSS